MKRTLIAVVLVTLSCTESDATTGPTFTTLSIVTSSLPAGVRDVAYSETLVADGGNGVYSWAVTAGALPAGLNLAESSGVISGTPSQQGSTSFSLQVSSGDGQTATTQLELEVLPPPALQPDELCSDNPVTAVASFEDSNFEAAIRGALSIGVQDDLTCGLLEGLSYVSGRGDGIVSLVGAQNLVGLYSADLQENSIAELTALGGLTGLGSLNLYSNSITDVGALSGLTDLVVLVLWDNPLTDLSPLSGLVNLEFLELWGNPTPITDISALSTLTGLTRLFLEDNAITDISALAGLVELDELDLAGNDITDLGALSGLPLLSRLYLEGNTSLSDIQPLLDNPDLGANDGVDLRSTSVSCTDVAALEAKGVNVSSDCP